MARAASSLPVPVSPVTRTVELVGATLDTREKLLAMRGSSTMSSTWIFVDFFTQRNVLLVELILQGLDSSKACSRAFLAFRCSVTSITVPTNSIAWPESLVMAWAMVRTYLMELSGRTMP